MDSNMDKHKLSGYCWIPVCAASVNAACCAALVVLRQQCMDAKTYSFIDRYCLSDNNMRAVVSAFLTVMIFVVAAMVSSAIKSYRTYKLKDGINEGFFISLASGFSYRVQSLKNYRWAPIIVAIVIAEYAPELLQPLSGVSITTESVYVRNSLTVENVDMLANYSANTNNLLRSEQEYPPNGVVVLPLAATYGTQNSVPYGDEVGTRVVRYTLGLQTNGSTDSAYGDYSFRHRDVTAEIRTQCSRNRTENVNFVDTDNKFVQLIKAGNYSTGIYVNSTYRVDNAAAIFNIKKNIYTCYNVGQCDYTSTSCVSVLRLSVDDMIYTLSTKKVLSLKASSTDLSISTGRFAEVVNKYIFAPEYIVYSFGGFPENLESVDPQFATRVSHIESVMSSRVVAGAGLFSSSEENELHARMSAGASVCLGRLHAYGYPVDENNVPVFDTTYPNLYTAVNQAYMPIYYVCVVISLVMFITVAALLIDLISFALSPINIKDTNELALIDNVSKDMMAARKDYEMSNNTSRQEEAAFDHIMYCREEATSSGTKISINYDGTGNIPSPHKAYS